MFGQKDVAWLYRIEGEAVIFLSADSSPLGSFSSGAALLLRSLFLNKTGNA